MQNAFDRFTLTYCINLDRRADRWEETSKLFREYGVNKVERFSGIQVPEGKYEADKKQLAQLGCALSFYSILKRGYNAGSVLIFEDDICFNFSPEETNGYLNSFLDELPGNWDMFYLGTNLHSEYSINPITKFSDNLYTVNSCYATHGMAFSNQGIRKFLSLFRDEEDYILFIRDKYKAIDVFIAEEFLPRANCFIGSEILAGQRDDFSDIEGYHCAYNNEFINRFNLFKNSL